MSRSLRAMRQKAEAWLRQGISPQRLALTLALGFAIGCIPVIGLPTAVCLVVALGLRLNMPAIQAANYAAMPFQIALVFPFVRLGGWLFSSTAHPGMNSGMLVQGSPNEDHLGFRKPCRRSVGSWLLTAVPMVLLLTLVLTALLRRVPVLASAEAGD